MRVAYSKSLDGPWQLEYFKGSDSPYYPGGIVFPWPRSVNCNVNNPAGLGESSPLASSGVGQRLSAGPQTQSLNHTHRN